MAWVEVDSSWLAAVNYEPETATLYVRFKDKAGNLRFTARYDNIPPELAHGLLDAPSKGEYFHSSGLYKRRYTQV